MTVGAQFVTDDKLVTSSVQLDIVNGKKLGLWFSPPKFCRKREGVIDLIVLHHTGGEGDGAQVFRTLEGRHLSVHFTVDNLGNVIQHADLMTTTYHAGDVNERSVGIEIANTGIAPAKEKVPRIEYKDSVHGHEVKYLRFLPSQVVSVAKLVDALCEVIPLPFKIPKTPGTGKALRATFSGLPSFRGVVGHLHLTRRKSDPSVHLLDDLINRATLPG